MEQFRVLSPSALLSAVHELPGSPGARRARAVVEHTRKPGLRGRSLRRSPLGFRAPRGEDTSEPIPRPQPGSSPSLGVGSAEAGALHKSEPISYALAFCFLLDAAHYPRYTHLHANITLPLRLHPVGCLHAHPLLCWPHLRPSCTTQNAQRRACAAYLQIHAMGNPLGHSCSNRTTSI